MIKIRAIFELNRDIFMWGKLGSGKLDRLVEESYEVLCVGRQQDVKLADLERLPTPVLKHALERHNLQDVRH